MIVARHEILECAPKKRSVPWGRFDLNPDSPPNRIVAHMRRRPTSTDLPARSLNAHGREYVSVRKSYRPYGTSRLLTQIQALRTWLLSFCPSGTGALSGCIPGISCLATIVLSPRDKFNRPEGTKSGSISVCKIDFIARGSTFTNSVSHVKPSSAATIGLVRANPWLADNPLSVKFSPEVVP
jgi:hypothetical protein